MRRHLTYANVAATLALWLALGGLSYAALKIPPHSVGAAQLRSGAVRQAALAVALGGAATEDDAVRAFTDPTRNCRSSGGGPVPPCVPPLPQRLISTRVNARRPGMLLVTATAAMTDTGAGAADSADVTIVAEVDGHRLPGQSTFDVPSGRKIEAAFQSSGRLRAGVHTVTLEINAINFDGELRVSPTSLHATLLPPAG